MWPQLLSALFGVIDKVLPDPQAAASAKLEAMKLQASAEGAQLEAATRLALAQIDINKADATSGNLMQYGWRPFIGWICGLALAWDTIGRPMVVMGWVMAGNAAPVLPTLSTEQLYGLIFGMLGLGGLRTVEKTKGAA